MFRKWWIIPNPETPVHEQFEHIIDHMEEEGYLRQLSCRKLSVINETSQLKIPRLVIPQWVHPVVNIKYVQSKFVDYMYWEFILISSTSDQLCLAYCLITQSWPFKMSLAFVFDIFTSLSSQNVVDILIYTPRPGYRNYYNLFAAILILLPTTSARRTVFWRRGEVKFCPNPYLPSLELYLLSLPSDSEPPFLLFRHRAPHYHVLSVSINIDGGEGSREGLREEEESGG